MTKDLPEIDDIMTGINDPDISYMDGLRKAAQNDDVVEEETTVKGQSEDKAETKVQGYENQSQVKTEDMDENKTRNKSAQVKAKESAPAPQPKTKASERKQKSSVQEQDSCWQNFIYFLQHTDEDEDKIWQRGNPIVRLKPVLAATLDECNIGNHCRSIVVNAIVYSFLERYKELLQPYRTTAKIKTLFDNDNPTQI